MSVKHRDDAAALAKSRGDKLHQLNKWNKAHYENYRDNCIQPTFGNTASAAPSIAPKPLTEDMPLFDVAVTVATVAKIPAPADELLMECSGFTSKYNSTAKPFTLCRETFIKTFSKHDIRSDKDGKLFAPATFIESRSNENFISAFGVCLDFDHGKPVVKQVLELFPSTLAAYYSTFSHTPENSRFRVVIPLSRPVNAVEHECLVSGIKSIIPPELMECLDTTCFEKARSHYLPSCPASNESCAFSGHQDGVPMDVDHFISLGKVAAVVSEPLPPVPAAIQEIAAASTPSASYEFTDPSTGEMYDLTTWAAKNPDFDIIAAVDPQYRRGNSKDGKQHIICPFEDQHTDQASDLATFIANASPPQYNAWDIHCCHTHCVDRDRSDFLRSMLENGWMAVDPLQTAGPVIIEMKRPKKIYYPVDDILAAPDWSTLNPDEFRIALHFTTLAWSENGTMPDDGWKLSRRLGITESDWNLYRETFIKTGWLIVSDGRLTNSIIKQEFDKAQTAYNTAITKAGNGGKKTQEKARLKHLLEAPA